MSFSDREESSILSSKFLSALRVIWLLPFPIVRLPSRRCKFQSSVNWYFLLCPKWFWFAYFLSNLVASLCLPTPIILSASCFRISLICAPSKMNGAFLNIFAFASWILRLPGVAQGTICNASLWYLNWASVSSPCYQCLETCFTDLSWQHSCNIFHHF